MVYQTKHIIPPCLSKNRPNVGRLNTNGGVLNNVVHTYTYHTGKGLKLNGRRRETSVGGSAPSAPMS